MWASDNVRLEEAHRAGVDEVLVCGRKYMVDMKVKKTTGRRDAPR